MFLIRLGILFWALWVVFPFQVLAVKETKETRSLEEFLTEATEAATRSRLNIDQIPSSFTVLDRQMIERSGAVTVADLLRFVPGLEVLKEGNGSYHLIVRGNYSDRRILLLWDGQPINYLLTRRALSFFGFLPVDILERVEISRGPASAVYGSYAVGGVVNLIPRHWHKGGEIGGAYGVFDTARFFTSLGVDQKNRSFQLSAGAVTTNGDQIYVKADADGYPGTVDTHYDTNWQEARLRLGRIKARLFRFYVANSHYYGLNDRLGKTNSPEYHVTWLGARISFDFELPHDISGQLYTNWRQDLVNYGTFYFFHPDPDGKLYPIAPSPYPTYVAEKIRLRENTTGLVLSRDLSAHHLLVGLEFSQNSIRSAEAKINRQLVCLDPTDMSTCLPPLPEMAPQRSPWPQVTERYWAVFFQDQWEFTKEDEFNLGLRFDKYKGFSGELSPRLVWIHRFSPKFISKLIYGHGFRVPDLDALYDDHSPIVRGNPDLKPEKLDSIESVFIFKPHPRHRFSLSLFRMWLRDVLGRRNPGGAGGWMYQQGGDENVWGGEFSWRYLGKQWDLYLFASYQWGENEFDEPRPYVANVLAGGIFSYSFPRWPWEINLSWNYVGPRWRERYNLTRRYGYLPDTRPKLGDYLLVNLKIFYDLTENTTLWLGVTNLFDADIRYPSSFGGVPEDYREQGRYLELGVRFRF